jgi:peptidoglycan/LPS O-acetylase OafA/YrhL
LDRPKIEAAATTEARVFHSLDALRGIAAIGVVSFHMRQLFVPIAAPGGYLAVDLFFMMSGVVLSHAYEGRFQAGMGTFGFMRARLIRLYPLYLLGTLLGIVVTVASLHGRNTQNWDVLSLLQAALLALLFLPNFSTRPVDQMFPLNIPCWSLFFEVLVNLLFVVCWRLLSSARLVTLCVVTGAVVLWATLHTGNIDQGSTGSTFAIGLARTIFGFCVGVLIARRVRHAPRSESDAKFVGIGIIFLVAIAGAPQGLLRALWDALCVLLVFPLLVYGATRVDPTARVRALATFLGVTSYAVYVLHSPISSIVNTGMRQVAERGGWGVGAPYTGIAVLTLLLIGCWLIDRYCDMLVRRWLSRVIPKSGARP